MKNTTSKKLSFQKFEITKLDNLTKITGGKKSGDIHKLDTTITYPTIKTLDTGEYNH